MNWYTCAGRRHCQQGIRVAGRLVAVRAGTLGALRGQCEFLVAGNCWSLSIYILSDVCDLRFLFSVKRRGSDVGIRPGASIYAQRLDVRTDHSFRDLDSWFAESILKSVFRAIVRDWLAFVESFRTSDALSHLEFHFVYGHRTVIEWVVDISAHAI